MIPKYRVCYRSVDGFEMYLQDYFCLFFAHHASKGLEFDSEKAAQEQIAKFGGRYRDAELAKLYVKKDGEK